MTNLNVTYLGLDLKNPIIAGSSGLTNSIENLRAIEKAGAGAIILKSIFEEETSLVVAGTHGKTTTCSLLASALHHAGLDPSFMIGGIVQEFQQNFRLGQGSYFISEGDEYDTAFFDKESKFLHYHPDIAIITSVEFDHARETDSIALQADGWHLRTDVYTSAGVMTSLAIIWIGHRLTPDPNVHWLDPVAALGVAALIIHAAYRLTLQAARDLLDTQLPPEEETWIRDLIRAHRPVIHGFHKLRTRKSGNFRFIEFHIKVDPEMSVGVSHRITEELSNSIEQHFPAASVTIHTEPCDGRCDESCRFGCLLNEEKRKEIMRQ